MTSQRCSYCGHETTDLSDRGTCRDCFQAGERVIDFMEAVAKRLHCMVLGCTATKRFDVTVLGHIVMRLPAGTNVYCGLHARRIARLLKRDRLQQAA
jgi:hypothetical protein